jgi:hypothetical protein
MSDMQAAEAAQELGAKIEALEMVFGAEYAKGFQDPVIFVKSTFHSPTVKQFYKREFGIVSRTLMVETVYRRRPTYNQSVLNDFAEMCARKLADILKLLTTQCERLALICKTSGVEGDASYLHPDHRLVPVIAGPAKGYLGLLAKLDELYMLTGSANLNGVLDSKGRMQMELLCRKAVRAFSAMVRNESIKLHKESQRMRMDNSAPDEELDRAERAHGEAVQQFDADMSEQSAIDPGAHVDPEMAGQVINDISTTTSATRSRKTAQKPSAGTVASLEDAAPTNQDKIQA